MKEVYIIWDKINVPTIKWLDYTHLLLVFFSTSLIINQEIKVSPCSSWSIFPNKVVSEPKLFAQLFLINWMGESVSAMIKLTYFNFWIWKSKMEDILYLRICMIHLNLKELSPQIKLRLIEKNEQKDYQSHLTVNQSKCVPPYFAWNRCQHSIDYTSPFLIRIMHKIKLVIRQIVNLKYKDRKQCVKVYEWVPGFDEPTVYYEVEFLW